MAPAPTTLTELLPTRPTMLAVSSKESLIAGIEVVLSRTAPVWMREVDFVRRGAFGCLVHSCNGPDPLDPIFISNSQDMADDILSCVDRSLLAAWAVDEAVAAQDARAVVRATQDAARPSEDWRPLIDIGLAEIARRQSRRYQGGVLRLLTDPSPPPVGALPSMLEQDTVQAFASMSTSSRVDIEYAFDPSDVTDLDADDRRALDAIVVAVNELLWCWSDAGSSAADRANAARSLARSVIGQGVGHVPEGARGLAIEGIAWALGDLDENKMVAVLDVLQPEFRKSWAVDIPSVVRERAQRDVRQVEGNDHGWRFT